MQKTYNLQIYHAGMEIGKNFPGAKQACGNLAGSTD